MSATTPAPLAQTLATAAAAYVAVWGVLRILLGAPGAGSWLAFVLLCTAFAIARVGDPRIGRLRAVATTALTAVAPALALSSPTGPLQITDAWLIAGVCSITLLVTGRGHALIAWTGAAAAVAGVALQGGLAALDQLGVVACVLATSVVAAANRTMGWYAGQLQQYGDTEREAIEWRAAQDAYQVAHQERIGQTARLAEGMLRRIVESGGRLDHEHRVECRLLHQAIRDETRGRRLLNDAVREQVMQHRRRGAVVQLLDDGDLDDLDEAELADLLDRVAESLAPLRSDRLIIRSAARDAEVAITVVATSSDPIAAALGMDDDEQVDLWLELPRPARLLTAAAR